MILAGLIVVCSTLDSLSFVHVNQRNIVRYRRHPPRGKWSLVQTPADAYVVCTVTTSLRMINLISRSCPYSVQIYYKRLGRLWMSGGYIMALWK